jgi:hypothetical protein
VEVQALGGKTRRRSDVVGVQVESNAQRLDQSITAMSNSIPSPGDFHEANGRASALGFGLS